MLARVLPNVGFNDRLETVERDTSAIFWGQTAVFYAPAKPPKLLDWMRDALRVRHYSYRTEQTYLDRLRLNLRTGKNSILPSAATGAQRIAVVVRCSSALFSIWVAVCQRLGAFSSTISARLLPRLATATRHLPAPGV